MDILVLLYSTPGAGLSSDLAEIQRDFRFHKASGVLINLHVPQYTEVLYQSLYIPWKTQTKQSKTQVISKGYIPLSKEVGGIFLVIEIGLCPVLHY